MPKPGETIVIDSSITNDDKIGQPKEVVKTEEKESLSISQPSPPPPLSQPPQKEMTLEERWGFDTTEVDTDKPKETNSEMLDVYGIQTEEEESEPVLVSLLPGSMKSKSKRPKFKANKSRTKFLKGKTRKK